MKCLFAFTFAALAAACGHPEQSTPPRAAPTTASKPSAPPSKSYADGAKALEAGDTVEAARIFAAVPEASPDYGRARAQLSSLTLEIASIAQVWLKQVDKSTRAEHYQNAHKRLEHMLEHFVLDDATRAHVEKRLQEVDQDAAIAVANLETLDQQTPAFVASGDLLHALQNMRRALQIARDAAPDGVLDRERRISALEQRLGPVPTTTKPSEPVASARKDTRRKNRREPAAAPASASTVTPTVVAGASTSTDDVADVEPLSEENRLTGLLEEADAFRENKAYFNAIVGYTRVRSIDRDNGRARAALNELEPQRQELVRTYLDAANRHFQQQDLARAVPYFRKVLLLEPDNIQAKKGLEMHYNLERIRREKRAAQ